MNQQYISGRGAQINPINPFQRLQLVTEHPEGIDEELAEPGQQIYYESATNVVNRVDSPDLGIMYSVNPYQGCEHGCIYCYARNAHQYWGFSAGQDFESKIIVKKNAPQLLEKFLLKKSWKPVPISLSGNTDCYQPLERKMKITRKLLEVLWKYRHPVAIITKNSLVLRDIDLLSEMARLSLVHVFVSITSLDNKLRQVLEPRTATAQKKLKVVRELSQAGIPVGLMNAPIIPGLNVDQIPKIIKASAEAGALTAGYTVVRLNGALNQLFRDWLDKNFPDRADKVWNQIQHLHGGKVNDTEFGRRIVGDGNLAEMISQLFKTSRKQYMGDRTLPPLSRKHFRSGGNLTLF